MPSDTMLGIELHAQSDGAGLKYQTSVAAGLLDCRKQFAELDIVRQQELRTHNDRLYNLAAVIFRLATRLCDQAVWREFVADADWRDRKRPRQRDHARAFRHAVRYVLPTDVSRQTISHWTIPLEVLRDNGVPETEIAQALRDSGGFQQICRARARAKRQRATSDNPLRMKLFKRPPSALPQILRNAIVVTGEDGQNRTEDGQDRVLLILAVPKHLLSGIHPGEVHISAVVGVNDISVLDTIGIVVELPASLIHLRKNPTQINEVITDGLELWPA